MNCNTFTVTVCGGGVHRGFITDAFLLAELERELTTSFYRKVSLTATHTSGSNKVSLFIGLMFVCWVWGGRRGRGVYVYYSFRKNSNIQGAVGEKNCIH